MSDYVKTMQLLRESISTVPEKYRVFAVPQGRDYEEWSNCHSEMLANPDVDVIGVPKSIDKWNYPMEHNGCVRTSVIRNINRKKYTITKPHHLLGLNNMSDLQVGSKYSWIRGCDSCVAYLAAMYDYKYIKSYDVHIAGGQRIRFKAWDMNFRIQLSPEQKQIFTSNSQFLDLVAEGEHDGIMPWMQK
jgi:hypothetical protein